MPELGETLEVVEDLEEGLEAEVDLEAEDIPEIQEVIKGIGRDLMAAVLIGRDLMGMAVHLGIDQDHLEVIEVHLETDQGLMEVQPGMEGLSFLEGVIDNNY